MIVRITLLLAAFLACSTDAVLNKKELQRREAFDSYGPPPRPSPQYGPPPQRVPHREYGVPQQIPFREYGPPSIKYGPPKLNFLGGGGGGGNAVNGGGGVFGGGLHEQIKSYFGVPKPFYGPPHISKPSPSYGPPPIPQPQYGPPPPRPGPSYGPPPNRPAPNYGPPPRPNYGPPPPQALPSIHPGPNFNPEHRPASSYGPPPSGPLNLPPKQIYGPPPPNYGPPPLPLNLPNQRPASFHGAPETTIIVTNENAHQGGGHGGGFGGGFGGGHGGGHGGGYGGHQGGGPVKQVQIQIDASGHTHSVSGSQAPFHTACDGWKPIPAPIGAYVEQNNIETQSGYSHVAQGASAGGNFGFGTQYSGGSNTQYSGGASAQYSGGSTGSGGSIVDGLTDEQLVAVALQSGGFDGTASGGSSGHHGGSSEQHGLNSIESDALQIALGANDDSYNKAPADSYAPGSAHAQRYNTINGLAPPNGNYGPPPPPNSGAAAFVHQHHSASAGLGLQYGSQSGNVHPFPPHGGAQPSKPVSFRPPVPPGLIESIGATVQHLDQFGVKPHIQPPTYIPPAANEIANSGPGNIGPEYGPPPQSIIEQQLPQQQTQIFVQEQHGGGGGGGSGGNSGQGFDQYGPPPPHALGPPPQQQYIPPPPAHGQPPNPQYLPPTTGGSASYQHGGSAANFEHAYSSSQYNQQYVHSQGLPLQQEPRFNHVHDCGQGPNLVGAGYQFQQQQQQPYANVAGGSATAYNSISQSIPVAEQHTQFLEGPSDSYGPPASGNELDHDGYASQKSAVVTLPDGISAQNLPGLDGLNVISAQKSESIQLSPEQAHTEQKSTHNFQLQVAGGDQDANHDEILSQGLLQSILTAIEQPQSNAQQTEEKHAHHLYTNHSAQSRADTDVSEDTTTTVEENESEASASTKVEVKAVAPAESEEEAIVKEIKPIVAEDVDEAPNDDEAKH